MIKKVFGIFAIALSLTAVSAQTESRPTETMRVEPDGTAIVNTTELGKDVHGFNGATPIEVHIKNGKITKIVLLEHKETPRYYKRIELELLPRLEGLAVKKLSKTRVDAVSGATYSADAVIENVRLAVAYYQKHKKKQRD